MVRSWWPGEDTGVSGISDDEDFCCVLLVLVGGSCFPGVVDASFDDDAKTPVACGVGVLVATLTGCVDIAGGTGGGSSLSIGDSLCLASEATSVTGWFESFPTLSPVFSSSC